MTSNIVGIIIGSTVLSDDIPIISLNERSKFKASADNWEKRGTEIGSMKSELIIFYMLTAGASQVVG